MSRRQFGPDGCLALIGDRICGEQETLQIIQQFKRLYESKLQQIEDEAGGGDCLPGLQAKVSLQQEWIRDLTQQNELLVRAVEELEQEASSRVAMLEQKLEMSVRKGSEVMQKYRDFSFSNKLYEEPSYKWEPKPQSNCRQLESMRHSDAQTLESMRHSDAHSLASKQRSNARSFEPMQYSNVQQLEAMLRSDIRSLIEFIRRIREEGSWSVCGLHFYTVCTENLLGICKPGECPCVEAEGNKIKTVEELEAKKEMLENMEDKIRELPSQEDLDNIAAKLQAREEELIAVKRSMMDMRNALTIEVADKHDIILNLRRDVQQLEDQCRQSNKQTQFKDDIIKELRKEIKQLKVEGYEENLIAFSEKNADLQENLGELNSVSSEEDCAALRLRLAQAEDEIKALKDAIFEANQELEKLYEQANEYLAERDDYKRKHNECTAKISQLQEDLQVAGEEHKRASQANNEAVEALRKSNESTLAELQRARRDSEAMSQAQNETIEVLQEALKQKDQESKVVETASGVSWETMGVEEETGSAAIITAESVKDVQVEPLPETVSETYEATESSKGQPVAGSDEDSKQEALLCECNEYDETGQPKPVESGDIICECMSLYNVGEEGKVSSCHARHHEKTPESGVGQRTISECAVGHGKPSIHGVAKAEISDYGLVQEGKVPAYGVEQGETSEYSIGQQEKASEYSVEQQGMPSRHSVEQQGMPSEYSGEQQEKPSEYSVEQQEMPSRHSVEQQRRPSEYSVEQQGKPSEFSVEQQGKPSDFSVEQQGMPCEYSVGPQRKVSEYSEGQQGKMFDYGTGQVEMPEYGVGQLAGDEDVERALRRGSVGELQRTLERLVQQREAERASHSKEMANLKATINELGRQPGGLEPDMQGDMELCQNSLNVLQASEERNKIEISQLRLTITNLQEALVASKQQLDQLQQKASGEVSLGWASRWFGTSTDSKEAISRYAQCIYNLENIVSTADHQCLQYYYEAKKLDSLIQCVRDTNLDLEVKNFGFLQDVAMLEARLLKYQSSFKSNEQCICALENELIQQQAQNTHLKQHLCALTCELTAMQRVINEAKQLHQRFLLLQEVHEDQLQETDAIRQELIRQAKLSEMDTTRIEELQHMLCEKTCQLSQFEQEYYSTQRELETALSHNQELKNEVAQLIIHIKRYEQSCMENEERTDLCEQEIEGCKSNLNEMKEKLVMISELLHEKIEQYNQLETSYYVQSNALACLKQQLAGKESCEEDVDDLRRTNEKLKCQICSLQTSMALSQEHAQATCGKLSKCLEDMSNLRAQRLCLETRNEQFRTELQDLQTAYDDLSQSYNRMRKSVVAVETELVDSKTDQDKICLESQNVVSYVRAWLHDQALINKQLDHKFKDDALIICRLKRKIAMMEAMKCKCCKNHNVNQQQPRECYNMAESYTSQTNVDSTVTVSSTDEVYMYEETEEDYMEDDCSPCPILKRVENMTQQVQNTNKYWQSQLGDHDYMVTRDQ